MIKTHKDLTAEDVEYLKHVYYSDSNHKEKMEILSAKFGVGERAIRKWWGIHNLKKTNSNLPSQLKAAQERALDKDTKVLLISSAQNKTSINKDFLNNLKAYKDYIENILGKKTEIVIIPARYRNPTSLIEDEKITSEDWWADEIKDSLFYGKLDFGDVLISCDSRISPTSSDPLTGYEILAENKHVVLPASKMHLKTLPRFRKDPLRVMVSTGYISNKNYSLSKSGERGHLLHSTGFVVLEMKTKNTCHIPRCIKVKKDGSFTDLIYSTENKVTSKIKKSLGFVWGDIHTRYLNRDFFNVSKELVKILNPEKSFLHDVYDGSVCNPHEVKDMFIQRIKITEGKHLLEDEMNECLDLIEEVKGCCGDVYVVESNHDAFLTRHIDNENWKKDLHNSHTYLKYAYIQQTVDLREYGNVFGYLIHERFGSEVIYAKMGDSMYIAGYQVLAHGDYGNSASRASTKGFSRMNLKILHGHTHSPMLHNNVTTVGVTCDLEQYYNRKGLSSWAYAHSVIHENGKNQLLVFNDDYSLTSLI